MLKQWVIVLQVYAASLSNYVISLFHDDNTFSINNDNLSEGPQIIKK